MRPFPRPPAEGIREAHLQFRLVHMKPNIYWAFVNSATLLQQPINHSLDFDCLN